MLSAAKRFFNSKIYDCFLFFKEFDLLDIRLATLYPYVDYFVIVEADKTFSGLSKPLYFYEQRYRYNRFADKIIYLEVRDMPDTNHYAEPQFALEYHQREQIRKGLTRCNKQDLIFLSDADEIINPARLKDALFLSQIMSGAIRLSQRWHLYYLNGFVKEAWEFVSCSSFNTFLKKYRFSAQALRWGKDERIFIRNGGWHFSYLGGADEIIEKISSFSHQEYNCQPYLDKEVIKKKIKEGKDLYDRKNFVIKYERIDKNYPAVVRDNISRYEHLIMPFPVTQAKKHNGNNRSGYFSNLLSNRKKLASETSSIMLKGG